MSCYSSNNTPGILTKYSYGKGGKTPTGAVRPKVKFLFDENIDTNESINY